MAARREECVRLARAAVGQSARGRSRLRAGARPPRLDCDDVRRRSRRRGAALRAARSRLEPANTDIIGNAAEPRCEPGPTGYVDRTRRVRQRARPGQSRRSCQPGLTYLGAGRFDQAIASLRTARRLAPEYSGAALPARDRAALKGEPQAALAEMQKEPEEVWRLLGLRDGLSHARAHEGLRCGVAS